MMTVNFLNLNWRTTLQRYFLMMFFVIVGVLSQMWVIVFLAFPVFLSAILGIEIKMKKEKQNTAKMTKINRDNVKKAI